MKFSDTVTAITEQFKTTTRVVPYIEGAPGGGKSALAALIGKKLDIPNVVQFFASLREPVDLLGIPKCDTETGCSMWYPPHEIAQLRTGRNLLILEELSDASVPMQNALCGLIHDRKVGSVALSDETYIIATGNRTKDKSGANRIVSKLGGRVRRFEYQENLDDWVEWALQANIDILGIQFLRFRASLLSDFTPDNFSSPTPRTWEKAFMTPTTLPPDLYLNCIAGDVGQAAAAEYVGFRQIAAGLPNIDVCLMDPTGCKIPTDPATLYAFTGAIAHKATKDNFDRVVALSERMADKPEFSLMMINDARKMKPEIVQTKAFTSWAVNNASLMF